LRSGTRERGGDILALLALVVGPVVVVVALTVDTSTDGVDVRGATEFPSTDFDADRVRPDIGLDSFQAPPEVAAPERAVDPEASEALVSGSPESVGPLLPTTTTTVPAESPTAINGSTTTPIEILQPGSTAAPTVSTTLAPSTTSPLPAPSVSTLPPRPVRDSIVPPTTAPPPPPPVAEPVPAAPRIDIGLIGESSLRYRVTFESTTVFTAVVRDETGIVASDQALAAAGVPVRLSASALTAGRTYTIEVSSDSGTSGTTVVRTAGSAETAPPATAPIEIVDVELLDVEPTRFVLRYRSTICGNGSFVIRDAAGRTVGRNSGQAVGCTTSHTAIPGFWTAALQPDETYSITVTVEADGAGLGNGNEDSASLTVTTSSA